MTEATDRFVHDLNVKNYNIQLLVAPDGALRAMLLRLLATELAHGRYRGWRQPAGEE